MHSSRAPIFGITLLTFAILGIFWLFGWFSVWSILGLAAVILAVLFLGNHLWVLAELLPLTIPIGFVGVLLVGRSYEYHITGLEVAILIFSAAALYALAWGQVRQGSNSRIELLLAAYIMLAIASFLWVQDFPKYLVAVRVAIYQFLAFFCARLFLPHREAREWLMRVVPVTVIVISLQLLAVLAHVGTLNRILIERSFITTPVGAMAFVTAIIVLLLPLVVVQMYRSQGLSRLSAYLAYLAFGLGVLAVLGSIGKAALLVMLISLWYVFYRLNKGKEFVKRAVLVGIVLVVLAGGGSLAPGLLIERFSNITNDVSSQFRVEEARTAFDVFLQHPIIGVGAGNLKYYFQRLLDGYDGESNVVVMQVAAEFGIIGLFLLMALIVSLRQTVHRLDHTITGRENRLMLIGFQGSLLAAALHGFLEVTFIGLAYGVLFWFLMGVLDAWHRSTNH